MSPSFRLPATLFALLLAGCRHDPPDAAAPPARIAGESISFPSGAPQLASLTTQPVGPGGAATTRLFGRLMWNDNVTVRVFTPFAGRIRSVRVEVGQKVEKGAPLAEVESADFGQAQADARTAESALRLADRNLERLRELYAQGAAARKDVEAAEAEQARAASERSRSLARLSTYGAGADSVTGLFVLRSPIAGTVVERNLTPGQEVRPDQMLANAPALFSPLFVLSDPSRLWIQIDATEAELGCLRPGCPFRFSTSAYPGLSFGGRLDVVSESIDPGTRTIKARGTVVDTRGLLKAEMFVNVDLPGEESRGASVPSRAVFLKGDRHYVFVEEQPGRFARHEVAIDDQGEDRVVVLAGVKPGQRVVTGGCVLLEQMLE